MPIRSLGPRIRQARQQVGLSGVALAKLIDKSQPYVSDLERGQRTPSLETLCSLSAALGQPLTWFLDAEEAPARSGKQELLASSLAAEIRNRLAELVADQLFQMPILQGETAPEREQMVRVVERAIDNAYHQLHRSLREQRQEQRTSVS